MKRALVAAAMAVGAVVALAVPSLRRYMKMKKM
jgi:Family of unknown function (DUF6893)